MTRIYRWLTAPVPVPTFLVLTLIAYLIIHAIPNVIWIVGYLTR